MKKFFVKKKFIINILLLILIVSNFSFSFAYWASNIASSQTDSYSIVEIGEWEYTNEVLTFKSDHASALALSVETVEVSDKAIVEAALEAYGLLSEDAKAELTAEQTLLLSLLTEIIAIENSEYLDFEEYVYDSLYTGTIDINDRTWYANNVAISNAPDYDVWIDTRSLALKSGSYFETNDLFINGIDKITLYHGALNYDNGSSFAFKVEYELQSNPGVWLTVQEGGADLIIDVLTGDPLTYVEIDVNITEALNIRFTPVISNTSDYINLDNITIYEHVVSSDLEVTTFKTVYAGALALTVGTVEISDKAAVEQALSAYDLLSVEAKANLTVEKTLLDNLLIEINEKEAIEAATISVEIAEGSILQADVDAAQILVTALPAGTEKTALQNRLDAVQDIIDEIILFETNHASALALTVGTVEVSDKAIVEAALADYALLSVEAKAKLTDEKTLLDNLLIEINNQIPTATQVAEFRADHASALALTVGTVDISDKAIVEAALTDYALLSEAAKIELTSEKTLLDNLLLEINIQEAEALVVIAETTNLQADLDAAQTLVTALPAGTEKTTLQNRLDAVQDIINDLAATSVDNLILAIPSTGEISLTDSNQIESARTAYEALTPLQKTLVEYEALLTSAEAELAALQTATDSVVIAETTNLQADVDAAQTLVTALPAGTEKTALQNRLDAVQDIIDVEAAKQIIINYFGSNSVVVSRLNNATTIKENAFLAKANEIVDGLDVIITIQNTVELGRRNTVYTIDIVKNGAIVTIDIEVTFTR
ncbi:MAG: hypothetical protein R6U15_06270 [Candidatus Izemoplasmatales bacterium]